jgi:hypothetical protein
MDKRKLKENDDQDELDFAEENDSVNEDDLRLMESDDGDDDRLEDDQREAQDAATDGDEANSRAARRRRQKERQRESMKKTREENEILIRELRAAQERIAALENRNLQVDTKTAETTYAAALAEIQRAEAQLKEAFETGDGDKAVNAQRLREQSLARAREAEELKRRITNPQPQQNLLDPLTDQYAKRWMRDNPWFDPAGQDEDSAIARAIDEAWSREAAQKGITPQSERYWEELDERVKRRLGQDEAERKPRKSAPPVTGRGEYSPRPTTKDNDTLTQERIQALKALNVWDNPEQRKKYIAAYKQYDRQNAGR